jgi:hypothetical protein
VRAFVVINLYPERSSSPVFAHEQRTRPSPPCFRRIPCFASYIPLFLYHTGLLALVSYSLVGLFLRSRFIFLALSLSPAFDSPLTGGRSNNTV